MTHEYDPLSSQYILHNAKEPLISKNVNVIYSNQGKYTGAVLSEFRFCDKCQEVKPPRAHHCKVCNQCVLRMDHHCPFVNNCIGYSNHKLFWNFLMYASLGCIHSAIIVLTVGDKSVSENFNYL